MTKTEKQATIDTLTKKFSDANFFYFTDTSGLTVEKINQLRILKNHSTNCAKKR